MNECGTCDGSGYVPNVVPDHAPDCEGECRNCPVPVLVAEACPECYWRWVDEQKRSVALTRPCEMAGTDPECYLVGDQVVRKMTYYPDEPETHWFCDHCAMAYVSFWQEQWDDYYAMVKGGLSSAAF
jgi:hypothetical protein